MKKVRSNARWIGLSREQRKTLEGWLFEDGMKFAEAWRRAQAELGFEGSISGLKRFYARRSQERVLEQLVKTKEEAEAIEAAPATAKLFRSASLKLMGQMLLQQVRDTPGEVKQWSALAKLMLWQEDIELRRQLKQEENQLRRENLAFARERFRFNVVRRAEKALPQLLELAEARKDPKMKEYEENKRMNEIMLNIFGSEVPQEDLHPENAEEEAAKEERERKKREEEARQAARVRQEAFARRQQEEAKGFEESRTTTRTTTSTNLEDDDEPMEEITMEELARMAGRPSVEEPVRKPAEEKSAWPTCTTDEELARKNS